MRCPYHTSVENFEGKLTWKDGIVALWVLINIDLLIN